MKTLLCFIFAVLILLLMGFIWPNVQHYFPNQVGLLFIITAIMLGNWLSQILPDKV